jgi:hypothetical protein
MISYVEKGIGLHEAIVAAGHWLFEKDGVWISSDDVAVQAIIDSYDSLPHAKKERVRQIREEAVGRSSRRIWAGVRDYDDLRMLRDLYESVNIVGATRKPRMDDLVAMHDAVEQALTEVQAATTVAQVRAVVVNWPWA